MTTFRSYGAVSPRRQVELMARFRGQVGAGNDGDLDVIE